jgi:integrase
MAHLSIALPRAPGEKRARAYRPSLGIAFVDGSDPRTASSRRALEALARTRYDQYVREGRVVRISGLAADGERVRVGMPLHDALAVFLDETKAAHPEKQSPRDGYAKKLLTFAEDRVCVEDWKTVRYWKEGDAPLTPLPLWKGDKRSAFVRIVGDDACERYRNHRLSRGVPQTVRLEINFLTEFHAWLKLRNWISVLPARCSVAKKSKGTRTGVQREHAVQFDEEEAIQILARIPMFNQRGGRRLGRRPEENGPHAFRVRDALRLMMEAALRPGHIDQLALGRHYFVGGDEIQITADIDKNHKDYVIRLTPAGREILERVAREDGDKILARGGLLFGEHSHDMLVKIAASEVLGPQRGQHCSAYDFRHATGRELMQATGGDLGAVQAGMAHGAATTTVQYLKPNVARGEAALLAASSARLLVAKRQGIDLTREDGRAVRGRKRADVEGARPASTQYVHSKPSATSHPDSRNTGKQAVGRRGLEPLRLAALAPQATSGVVIAEERPVTSRQRATRNAAKPQAPTRGCTVKTQYDEPEVDPVIAGLIALREVSAEAKDWATVALLSARIEALSKPVLSLVRKPAPRK